MRKYLSLPPLFALAFAIACADGPDGSGLDVTGLDGSSLAARQGQNGTTLAAIKTLDVCELPGGDLQASGDISVWNQGAVPTQGLNITDVLQYKIGSGQFQPVSGFTPTFTLGGNPAPPFGEIAAGTTLLTATVFQYVGTFTAIAGATYRNAAKVTILNHSSSLGTPTGPEPKFTFTGEILPCGNEGCVRTQGFWKNHTEAWPSGFDPNTTFFLSGKSWIQVLNTDPSNGSYYQLAHQYIAAVLNAASGAEVPAGVQASIDYATGFFNTTSPPGPTGAAKGTLVTNAGVLDDYNNGLYPDGPPHCGDES